MPSYLYIYLDNNYIHREGEVVWKKTTDFINRNTVFLVGAFFENVFSPKGWQKNSQNCKIPKCSDLIDFPMILPISICNFDAKHVPDAFKHVPGLF